ncbi:helix-turn-helix transcriptional regulator [Rhizobium calliandrae]|uniref:Helix-turn-helix transcriptional regulator n=1 Tax=Rhizobium calliandrae TaxID=1312182 RepID=A0ABT7KQA1_9HYPH|nr:helix-turn-helix transcriptional regulator [Rhizobium calliandrae]MDL2410802.1 helix-turn-helix transcriptional regulator [Rhizobium calliandrae]
MSISAAQCRAARALLAWSQDQLSVASNVAKATIANFETGKRMPYDRTLADIRLTLERAGVAFQAAGELIDGGEGVRLRNREA